MVKYFYISGKECSTLINADVKELTIKSGHDGLMLSVSVSVPYGNINGVVQIVHGMNEYKERYYNFIDYLAGNGFICVIHDNRGHGKSIAVPDDLGFMYENGGHGFVSDIAQISRIVNKKFPDIPHFMIAHSMGSLGARCFIRNHDSDIDGLIILGSPSYNIFSGLVRNISSAVIHGENSRLRSQRIYELSEKVFNRKYGSPPHSWICTRREVVEKFNSEPLCSFIYTLNGYQGLLYLMQNTYNPDGWKVKNPSLPVRFLSGRDDPVMISEKKFIKSVGFLEHAGYKNISYRLFDNMRHEVLNEKNNIAVYRDIAETLFLWTDKINRKKG